MAHYDRLREEEQELCEAQTYPEKICEASDVVFSISRAQHDGSDIQPLHNFFDRKYMPVYLYVFGKFSSRWLFHITASLLCHAPHVVREVVNPTKNRKVIRSCTRHQIDPVQFTRALIDWVSAGDRSGKTDNFWHFLSTGYGSISRMLYPLLPPVYGMVYMYAALRTRTIKKIGRDAEDNGKTAIVAGHFIFRSEGKEKDVVCNEADLDTYTHILYLDVQPEVIAQRRLEDQTRNRANDSVKNLQE
ncbi:hypothetical protein TSTA_117060 [Talaromyces stipitatus ATCC 10500]|uniref:Uncharacterized protein n=1 Tax=Talaromyces stipitatus (strain ATCC 10500 / CBS 375.48 / QM 6759 / NRRL 1006) TaxID=441959 RepID=B8MDF7_TALSN|nr:uncharacterized protein TSTA_117060 [Talaromyces stipitatus ATCC 10500]EED17920.1 hypothetical protein TSTA_117060 [Talaromyces stipitatus ATCC 10500]